MSARLIMAVVWSYVITLLDLISAIVRMVMSYPVIITIVLVRIYVNDLQLHS